MMDDIISLGLHMEAGTWAGCIVQSPGQEGTGRGEMTIVQMQNVPSQVWKGIYDPPEAARYIRASRNADNVYPLGSAKLRRWIRRRPERS